MTVIELLKEVSTRADQKLESTTNSGESVKDFLLRGLNMHRADLNKRRNWPWRVKTTYVQTVANYTDGTVTVTNGSRTVSVSGGAFTSAMVGRFFKLDREAEMYEIAAVPNSSTLTLRLPYIGAGASSQPYRVWKRYYELDPDVPNHKSIVLGQWPYTIRWIDEGQFNSAFIQPYLQGYPEAWTLGGVDRSVSAYSTGTISVTTGTRTFTGSGTSWLGNIFNGSKVTVGTNSYNVETVDSDTQFTSVQLANKTESGLTYSAETKERTRIALSSVPNPVVNVQVNYFKRTYNLAHDDDELGVWDGFEHILSNVLHGYTLEKLTSEKAFEWLNVYERQIREGWSNLQEAGYTANPHNSGDAARRMGYRPALYGR